MIKNHAGFSLIELLIVISIMAIISTISIPAYKNYSAKQQVVQNANNIKSELRNIQNKSSSGVNGHWFGMSLHSKSSLTGQNGEKYGLYESKNDSSSCPITILDSTNPSCNQTITTKPYLTDVYLNKISITRIDEITGNTTQQVSDSVDIRFNQSPFSNQVVIASLNNYPDIVRVELLFNSSTFQRSIVIDGGNICINDTTCPGLVPPVGGPRAGRVFLVDK